MDSPIILSLTYKSYYKSTQYPATLYGDTFDKLLLEIHNQYDNINIVLERGVGIHNNDERYQDLEQSVDLDTVIEESLRRHELPYHKIKVDDNTLTNILNLL